MQLVMKFLSTYACNHLKKILEKNNFQTLVIM